MSDLRDKTADVIALHWGETDSPLDAADAVLSVLDLDKIRAEAWDEGHSWGWSDAQDAHDVRQEMTRNEWHLATPNPYRKEQSDE